MLIYTVKRYIYLASTGEGFINVISLLCVSEEFSLKIVQLNLEDDDRYQCQVMATANSSSLVSQFAYVNVLGKFSLKIVQLNLEDDDRYQCQVMATANSFSLVSQFAYVNVLGKF